MQKVLFELLERLFSKSGLQESISADSLRTLPSVLQRFDYLLSEKHEPDLVYCGLSNNDSLNRFFSPEELFKLGTDGAQLLNSLVVLRIITPQQREDMLQQVLTLAPEALSLEEIKELLYATITEDMDPINAVWLESILFHEQTHSYMH